MDVPPAARATAPATGSAAGYCSWTLIAFGPLGPSSLS